MKRMSRDFPWRGKASPELVSWHVSRQQRFKRCVCWIERGCQVYPDFAANVVVSVNIKEMHHSNAWCIFGCGQLIAWNFSLPKLCEPPFWVGVFAKSFDLNPSGDFAQLRTGYDQTRYLYNLQQCFSTFLLQRNFPQMFALLMEPYAMIQVSIQQMGGNVASMFYFYASAEPLAATRDTDVHQQENSEGALHKSWYVKKYRANHLAF